MDDDGSLADGVAAMAVDDADVDAATSTIDVHYPSACEGAPWVVVHPAHDGDNGYDAIESATASSPPSPQSPVAVSGGFVRVTYKDMLLKRPDNYPDAAATAAATATAALVVLQPARWRPRIEVHSVAWKRVDKEYGTPIRDPYYDESDGASSTYFPYLYLRRPDCTAGCSHGRPHHDMTRPFPFASLLFLSDFGMEDVIAGEICMKQHVGASRLRAVSMLPLTTLEKKMNRIAEKASMSATPGTVTTAS